MYSSEIVLPMKMELIQHGFKDIMNPNLVEDNVKNYSSTLFVINSVCGCSASSLRPGILLSLQNKKKPENLATVFAGYDLESTKKLREYLLPFPPSSPSIAFFKSGHLIHMFERHHIEGHSSELISNELKKIYDQYC